jgi:hypothetical protein
MTKKLDWWWQLGGGILTLMGVILSVGGLYSSEDWAQNLLAMGLSLIALVATLMAFGTLRAASNRQKDSQRAVAWSKALKNVSDGAQHIADLAADTDSELARERRSRARSACYELEKAFTLATGADCRVTMKEVYAEADGLAVRSLIAPSRHAMKTDVVDYIASNTDFQKIMEGEELYFCNDIPSELTRGYQNSHWTPDLLHKWSQNGEYPYQSTLVLPIRARTADSPGKAERWETVGFFCVDSQTQKIFSIKDDRHVAEVTAAMFMAVWGVIIEAEAEPNEVE